MALRLIVNIRCLFSVLMIFAHLVRACNLKFHFLQSSFICFSKVKHINELCKSGNLKLHALTKCAKFTSTDKRHLIFKAFIISLFNYCPLVWMFHTKQLNNRINSLHENALRVAYQDRNSSFNELLKLDKSVSIHYRNIMNIYLFYLRKYIK